MQTVMAVIIFGCRFHAQQDKTIYLFRNLWHKKKDVGGLNARAYNQEEGRKITSASSLMTLLQCCVYSPGKVCIKKVCTIYRT